MRHRTHHHRTVAAAAAHTLSSAGAECAVLLAAQPAVPEWSL
ncbi:hypothetical protein [Kocuria nitroreducens]